MFYPSLLQKLDAGNQLALIEDLHRDIRIVGNEAKGEHVPGFCIPKKVKAQNECGFITASIPHLWGELIDIVAIRSSDYLGNPNLYIGGLFVG